VLGQAVRLLRSGPPGDRGQFSGCPSKALRPSGEPLRIHLLHPRGCRARPHGVRETYRGSGAESSVVSGSTRPASPFGGIPVFPRAPRDRDRRPEPRLSMSRLVTAAFPRPHVGDSRLAPPSGRPEDRRRDALTRGTALPSWALVLYSASSAADPVTGSLTALPRRDDHPRGAQPRHLPPSAFRWCTLARAPSTPSAVYSPPRLPSRLTRATRNAPEVPSSGLVLHGAWVPLSRPQLSCALIPPASPLSAAHETRLQSLVLPGNPHRSGPKPLCDRCPPDVLPSKASCPHGLDPASRFRLPCASPHRSCKQRAGAPEHLPRRDPRFLRL